MVLMPQWERGRESERERGNFKKRVNIVKTGAGWDEKVYHEDFYS